VPGAGLEPEIAVFEWSKTLCNLNLATTVLRVV